ncbi:von willebrand factor a domain-containing protein 5a [Anaeramoeba ignava]|uniref:von willebrand factor a domain-containing protein 5a n=1 Tax=Anaeramoeba ignava TaxID=1746090 RepID=A0A9Q0LKU1_ANAIG|nr:von willebrand factor a domain-containing protein 5a [Anaeramoeba ignava]
MVRIGLVNNKTSNTVPLKGISVNCEIFGFTASVTLNQRYENEENNPIETVFVFPLDSESAVCGFEVFLEGKHIIGKVKEKQKAREIYDDAIAQGKTAAKMEEEKPDVFVTNVGNLGAKKQCVVTIRYVTILSEEPDGRYRFFLPTTIAPRYVPVEHIEESQQTDLANVEYSQKVPYGYTINISMEMQSKITNVTSPTHEINPILNSKYCTVSLQPSEKEVGKDIVVLVQEEYPHEPRVVTREDKEGEVVAMATLFPDLSELDVNSEMIFLLDRSGSMSGSPINSVKKTLEIFLHSLPESCFFNIYGFGSTFEKLFPESVMYDDNSLSQAKAHALDLKADLGGTELIGVLREIFRSSARKGFSRQVFLLTDGEVWDTQNCLDIVKRNRGSTRVFTFGIGHGASKELVEGIARAGGGQAEFIVENEEIKSKVLRQLRLALQPCLSNTKIEWKDIKAPELVTPWRLPPIFSLSRFLIFMFFDKKEVEEQRNQNQAKSPTLILSALSGNKEFSWELPLSFDESIRQPNALHPLAAKWMIREMTEKTSKFHNDQGSLLQGITQEFIDKEIIRLGTTYQIVSSKTSFVATVENEDESENIEEIVVRKIPVQKPVEKPVQSARQYSPKSFSLSYSLRKPSPSHMIQDTMDDAIFDEDDEDIEDEVNQVLEEIYSEVGLSLNALTPINSLSKAEEKEDEMDNLEYRLSLLKSDGSPPIREKSVSPEPVIKHINQNKSTNQSPIIIVTDSEKSILPPKNLSVVESIIYLQKANGSWDLTEELSSQISLSTEKIRKEIPENISENVWITAIVVFYLETKHSSVQDEWFLVVEKARKWLKKNSSINLENLIQKAKNLF